VSTAARSRRRPAAGVALARASLVAGAIAVLGILLVAPVLTVIFESLRDGLGAYVAAVTSPDALSALRLTLLAAAIAVPLNAAFGLAIAWAVARFEFPGRRALVTLVDLPLAVSPVLSGMVFVLLFGAHGWLGPWLARRDLEVVFAVPGIVLATTFVTVPYVARELVPFLQSQRGEEELAALTLGASGWQMWTKVTLPSIKWALLYGVVLCNARAMGEFGAVSVVSGHVRGETNTLPLHVEVLYDEYAFSGAFAVSTLLVGLALVTLVVKKWIEAKSPEPR